MFIECNSVYFGIENTANYSKENQFEAVVIIDTSDRECT